MPSVSPFVANRLHPADAIGMHQPNAPHGQGDAPHLTPVAELVENPIAATPDEHVLPSSQFQLRPPTFVDEQPSARVNPHHAPPMMDAPRPVRQPPPFDPNDLLNALPHGLSKPMLWRGDLFTQLHPEAATRAGVKPADRVLLDAARNTPAGTPMPHVPVQRSVRAQKPFDASDLQVNGHRPTDIAAQAADHELDL
jgi:hypothetical protein